MPSRNYIYIDFAFFSKITLWLIVSMFDVRNNSWKVKRLTNWLVILSRQKILYSFFRSMSLAKLNTIEWNSKGFNYFEFLYFVLWIHTNINAVENICNKHNETEKIISVQLFWVPILCVVNSYKHQCCRTT
jgi:hypothetical protein